MIVASTGDIVEVDWCALRVFEIELKDGFWAYLHASEFQHVLEVIDEAQP